MKLTVLYGEETFEMEVATGDLWTQVMLTLEGLTGVPSAQQSLIANSRKLDLRGTVAGSGLQDGDLVLLEEGTRPQVQPAVPQLSTDSQLAAFFEHCRTVPETVQHLPPAIQDAVFNNNFNAFLEHIREWLAEQQRIKQQKRFEQELASADQFDPEAQARIAEYIRTKNVDENMQLAFDECPEAFSDVIMLYVNLEVNNHPIQAFVDSGAQRSIMSHECAERCNILHLMDTRFAGVARGVGQGKILGRVHAVQMKVGDKYLSLSITVLESKDVDFLFGLDMLRRYQCSIDLLKNVLRFPSINLELPFLAEHELPIGARHPLPAEEAPIASGANPGGAAGGQALGGQTGASNLRPAEAAARAAQARAAAAAPIERTSLQQRAGVPTSSGVPSTPAPGLTSEEKVQRLMAFGFARAECMTALQATDGNEEYAASLLFDRAF